MVQQYLMTGWGGLAPKKKAEPTQKPKETAKAEPAPKPKEAAKTEPAPAAPRPAASPKKGQVTRARKRKR
jgi:hypothetical protein